MIYLPNGCYCSELKVTPSNWKAAKKLQKDWLIYYRFYDPAAKRRGLYLKGKLVGVKGMNHFKTIADRRNATITLLEDEVKRLQQGYNPINGDAASAVDIATLGPASPFLQALETVETAISASPSTKRDLRSILRFVNSAATQLQYEKLTIGVITRKHIKLLLAQIERNHAKESHHRYNKVRGYLMILFKELVELEAIENNPVREISKKTGVRVLRKVLTLEERAIIDKYLQEHDKTFCIFTHIFFHSGARLTELMKVRLEDVNISNQTFKVTVIKGRSKKEVLKPIKNVAVPFWNMAISEATSGQYIFSEGLTPGDEAVRSD